MRVISREEVETNYKESLSLLDISDKYEALTGFQPQSIISSKKIHAKENYWVTIRVSNPIEAKEVFEKLNPKVNYSFSTSLGETHTFAKCMADYCEGLVTINCFMGEDKVSIRLPMESYKKDFRTWKVSKNFGTMPVSGNHVYYHCQKYDNPVSFMSAIFDEL